MTMGNVIVKINVSVIKTTSDNFVNLKTFALRIVEIIPIVIRKEIVYVIMGITVINVKNSINVPTTVQVKKMDCVSKTSIATASKITMELTALLKI